MIFKKSILSLVAIGSLMFIGCEKPKEGAESNSTTAPVETSKSEAPASTQNAENQIKMVGSSTVYPFASAVAEELGATGGVPTPVVESTGTGGGMEMFCKASGAPEITNASRAMKAKEFAECKKNGITNITEAQIGYDGIVLAQDKGSEPMKLSREQIFMAVAGKVPAKDGKSIIDNPYKNWNEIDATLPNKPISVYGPPKSSGTRDSFEEMVVEHVADKKFKELYEAAGEKKYKSIRTDGLYIESGENDNLIVQKLTKDKNAIGVFGFGFLEENADKIIAAQVDGATPTPATIAEGAYPISRSLFFYIKNDARATVPALDKYIELFMSEKMIGERGSLKKLGLVPMPKDKLATMIADVKSKKAMSGEGLK